MPGIVFQRGTLLIQTGPNPHLHIVMNDPVHCTELRELSVLVVNISSVRDHAYHDQSCILRNGCHPFVRWDSWVMYSHATVLRLPRLEQNIVSGDIQPQAALDVATFGSVRAGFDLSPHVKVKIARYLRVHQI